MQRDEVVEHGGAAALEARDVDDRGDLDVVDLGMFAKGVEHPEPSGDVTYGERPEEAPPAVGQIGLFEIARPRSQRRHEPLVTHVADAGRRDGVLDDVTGSRTTIHRASIADRRLR
jgi:hypothetical protein